MPRPRSQAIAKEGGLPLISGVVHGPGSVETETLRRAEKRLWRDVDGDSKNVAARTRSPSCNRPSPPWTPPGRAAGAGRGQDHRQYAPGGGELRRLPGCLPPRRPSISRPSERFETLHTDVTAASDKVVALASVDKPWLLASRRARTPTSSGRITRRRPRPCPRLNDLSTTVATANDLHALAAPHRSRRREEKRRRARRGIFRRRALNGSETMVRLWGRKPRPALFVLRRCAS